MAFTFNSASVTKELQNGWNRCPVPANCMYLLTAGTVGALCAKHAVPYADYLQINGEVGKLKNKGQSFNPISRDQYIAIGTPNAVSVRTLDMESAVWLTYDQLQQFGKAMQYHSKARAPWETQQFLQWFAFAYSSCVAPMDKTKLKPDVRIRHIFHNK